MHKVNAIVPPENNEITTISGKKLEGVPQPRVIYFTDGAKKVIDTFKSLCNEHRLADIRRGANTASIWARTCEHAIKLALVSHDIDKGVICEDVAKWACELSLFLSRLACKAVEENISDNEHEATLKRVHKIIVNYSNKYGRPMRKRELAQRTKAIKNRDLGEMLSKMQEAGMIIVTRQTNESNGSTTEFFDVDRSYGNE